MTRVYRKSADYIIRRIGGESVLVPIRSNVGDLSSVFTLNAVAETVWAAINGTSDIAAIVRKVCSEYEIEPETAAADVQELLDTFQEVKLIS